MQYFPDIGPGWATVKGHSRSYGSTDNTGGPTNVPQYLVSFQRPATV